MAHNKIGNILPISIKQFFIVLLLAFVVPIISIIMIVNFATSWNKTGVGSDVLSEESIKSRISPVAHFKFQDPIASQKTYKTGEQIFSNVCAACHLSGIAGAPKLGDNSAWAGIIQAGYEIALKIAIEGKGAMPPKGGSLNLSDYEVARAVVYMANSAGGKFEEPEEPS